MQPWNFRHNVYLLKSTTTRRTYIGYTVNIKRRLRQHNGEIKGGAKATRRGRPWKLICYVTGFPYETTALQYEWRNHHPPKGLRRRGIGVKGRIENMKKILTLERYTNNALSTTEFRTMIIFVDKEYYKYWK